MRIIALLNLFLINLLFAQAQSGLIVRNTKDSSAWMYELGAKITYIRFHEQEYFTGRLSALFDSSVVIGKDTVPVKTIAGIRKRNPVHKTARVIGMPLMLIGSIFMGTGIAGIYENPDSNNGVKIFLLGAGIFALGYLPYEANFQELDIGLGGNWTLEICKECRLP